MSAQPIAPAWEPATVEVDPLTREEAEAVAAEMGPLAVIYYRADGHGAVVDSQRGTMVCVFTTCGCCMHTTTITDFEETLNDED